MSAQVIETFNGRLWAQLDAARCARKIVLPDGTTWSRVRVGALVSLSGAATSVTPVFGMGICSGTTNIFGDATTTHWIGIYSVANWTYNGSGGYASGTIAFAKKVGASVTTSGGASGYDIADCGVLNHVSGYFVDIVRGSPNYTIEIVANDTVPTGANSLSVTTFGNLMKYKQSINSFRPAGYYFTSSTIACDESVDGYFDSANVSWSGTGTAFCIDRIDTAVF